MLIWGLFLKIWILIVVITIMHAVRGNPYQKRRRSSVRGRLPIIFFLRVLEIFSLDLLVARGVIGPTYVHVDNNFLSTLVKRKSSMLLLRIYRINSSQKDSRVWTIAILGFDCLPFELASQVFVVEIQPDHGALGLLAVVQTRWDICSGEGWSLTHCLPSSTGKSSKSRRSLVLGARASRRSDKVSMPRWFGHHASDSSKVSDRACAPSRAPCSINTFWLTSAKRLHHELAN